MLINIDKRFIEILNERGYKITWKEFLAAYSVRKEERGKEPKKRPVDLSEYEAIFKKFI